jgi:hypothetical protein
MKIRFAFLFVVSIAMLFSGCSDDDDKSPTGPGGGGSIDPMPLKIGNWWALHTVVTLNDLPLSDDYDTMRIDTSLTWGGKLWYGDKSDSSYFRNESDGVWNLLMDSEHPAGLSELMVKYPVSVGQSWMTPSDSMTYRVVALNQTVVVPAGSLTGCINCTGTTPDGATFNLSYKPGLGQVKSEGTIDFLGTPMHIDMQLSGYHLE